MQRLRIGIIGTGAIGGFYGLMLAKAGHDVHFLLRSEYQAVVANGLRLNSAVHGQLHLQPVQAWGDPAEMPPCDWLLVGAKTTSNAQLAPVITRLSRPGARVVLLQNGLAVEEQLRPLLPDNLHLLGGLCFICTHRAAPGVIEHQALGTVNLGYHSGPARAGESLAIVEEGAELFRSAGLESVAMADLQQARWQKLVWNVPYNGLSVLLGAGTTRLMANADSRALILELMREVVQGAAACGQVLPEGYPEKLLATTERMPDYLPSMYHDFQHKRPLELQAIYAAPLAAAAAAGCELPKMRMLHQALRFLDAG
ncbi:putative 2-dehydropantoate 2-reductase [Aquipseudomonas alcaligenes]|uniref:2-dehydropantoate 2-reductase n=1 Tax=Aquipseudomonas alcaligenes TaxID=43263 RepID=A0AA37CDI3_AQUAC|nr:putative 2-dehydropantoate 2-reductase [Pseudomonas alcaligenes]BCR24679.1 2-dehydropantoate 2-reductase [Pseudomonas alcaligenes]GIZ66206.1 2-dehydropantoate 2-reductase [Pseudomonas alcaligenes]GIZ70201.1 2-dehydropantoate 2-reductase [Pseudomonas alcaligenes]GIZ74554.1 2-dehydropantoate 2-reductase [Pseudomonas alcaligenes]GIZ79220.1 2-dehydropantoate 2-reductase [Pseudomonas alcaligenes]